MYLCDIKLHTIIQLWNFAKRIYCAFRKPSGIIYIIFIEWFSFIIGYGQYKWTEYGWATAIAFAIIGSLPLKCHKQMRKRTELVYGWILKSKRFGIRREDEKRTVTCTMKYNARRIGFTRKRTHRTYYSGETFHQTLTRVSFLLFISTSSL